MENEIKQLKEQVSRLGELVAELVAATHLRPFDENVLQMTFGQIDAEGDKHWRRLEEIRDRIVAVARQARGDDP